MGSAELLGKYQTAEKYPLIISGERCVPYMINSPGEGCQVEGELYEVDDNCLKSIDALECTDQPDGYRRQTIIVVSNETMNPDRREAQAYLIEPDLVRGRQSNYLRTYSIEAARKYRPRSGN
jgi:gamma-glutamylaminecyclotransferase